MKARTGLVVLVLVVGAIGAGCDDHGGMMKMTRPSDMGFAARTTFMSVSPAGGASGVSTTTAITIHFGVAMAGGMEQFIDLHARNLAGPTVPMNCAWSGDRTALTCTPLEPLQPRTTYVVHMGGGLMSWAGQPIDYGQYGPMMGGQWITGGMMGGSHAGVAWGMMGTGWGHGNGAAGYGMTFSFTTA